MNIVATGLPATIEDYQIALNAAFAGGEAYGRAKAQQPAPVPEQPAQDEPVAVVTGTYGGRFTVEPLKPAAVLPVNMALYTRPQAREPLSPAEVNQIEARWDACMHGSKVAFVVRETEAAHGIHALTERGEKK